MESNFFNGFASDNRRYDYDSRLFRHPKPGNNQFSPRFTVRL